MVEMKIVSFTEKNESVFWPTQYLAKTDSPDLGIVGLIRSLYLVVQNPSYLLESPEDFF